MSGINDLDYKLYVIAELNYRKAHPQLPVEVLYPNDWNSFTNYRTKSEIIAEALQKQELIINTERYQIESQDVRMSQ